MTIIRVGDKITVEYAMRDLVNELNLQHPSLNYISIEAIKKELWWLNTEQGYKWYEPKAKHFRYSMEAYNRDTKDIISLLKTDPDTTYSVGDSKHDIERKLRLRLICIKDLLNKKLNEIKEESKRLDFTTEVTVFSTEEELKQKKLDNIIKEVDKITNEPSV